MGTASPQSPGSACYETSNGETCLHPNWPLATVFSTVKARTKRTKGAGSRKAGLAMAFKLLLGAERHWRKINAPHLVALVQAGVSFPDGEQFTLKAA